MFSALAFAVALSGAVQGSDDPLGLQRQLFAHAPSMQTFGRYTVDIAGKVSGDGPKITDKDFGVHLKVKPEVKAVMPAGFEAMQFDSPIVVLVSAQLPPNEADLFTKEFAKSAAKDGGMNLKDCRDSFPGWAFWPCMQNADQSHTTISSGSFEGGRAMEMSFYNGGRAYTIIAVFIDLGDITAKMGKPKNDEDAAKMKMAMAFMPKQSDQNRSAFQEAQFETICRSVLPMARGM